MKISCAYCGKECDKQSGHVNRAKCLGLNIYCDRKCAGFGRRVSRDNDEKKRLKSEYDKVYRATNPTLKERKSAYHKKNYDPNKQKEYNKIHYPKHLEYLRQPKWVEYKREYDRKYRAAKLYGEFSEAALLLKELEGILDSQKIKQDTGISFNKSSQQRKRKWNSLQVKT